MHRTDFIKSIIILLCVGMCYPFAAHALTFSEKITNVLYGSGVNLVQDYRGVSISIPTDEMFMRVPAEDPRIDPHYFYVMDTIVNVIQNYSRERQLEITGHTDDLWTSVEEKLVSQRYAEAVSEYLVSRGVDGRRIIKVLGQGSGEPVGNNRQFGGRILNRRVEILIVPPRGEEAEMVEEKEEEPFRYEK